MSARIFPKDDFFCAAEVWAEAGYEPGTKTTPTQSGQRAVNPQRACIVSYKCAPLDRVEKKGQKERVVTGC
jgi:hypothetical protein